MAQRFEGIKVGDQLEMPLGRFTPLHYVKKTHNPDAVARVAVVTDIWHDPVERKDFVGLATLKADGSYGRPTIKHTIRGLAMQGWRWAEHDWIARIKGIEDGKSEGKVTTIYNRRKR